MNNTNKPSGSALSEASENSELIAILDGIDAVVYVADIETYEILYINKYTKKTFGDIKGELCWKSLQSNQTGPCYFCTNDKLLGPEGKPSDTYQWEFHNTKNGHWYSIQDKAITWVDGRIVRLEIATNITERKKAENIIFDISKKISSKVGISYFKSAVLYMADVLKVKYAFIGELVSDNMKSVKTLAVCANGKIVDNIQYELKGTPCENVVGNKLCSYPDKVQQEFPDDILLQQMGVNSYLGAPLFSASNEPLGIIVVLDEDPLENLDFARALFQIFSDRVSSEIDRMRSKEMIHEREQRFRDLVENTSDWIWEVDESAKYTYASPKIRDILGYTPEEIIGKTPFDLMPPEEARKVADKFREITDSRKSFSDLQNTNFHKDGRLITLETSGVPVYDRNSRFRGYRGIDRDITARKNAESLLKETITKKDFLLREVHHRTKNNMNVICSMLAIHEKSLQNEMMKSVFNDVSNRIRSMALVHEKLYGSENISDVDFKEYLTDLANSLFNNYRLELEKVALRIDMQPITLSIDNAVPCGLVMNELISNALKHAFPDDKTGEIHIILGFTEADEIKLTVLDTGIGMPPEFDLNKSESFGLKISKILVEKQMHGKFSFAPGSGAEFTICFSDKQD